MLPSIRLPAVSAGIWPETKICGPAMMAWDYYVGLVYGMVYGECGVYAVEEEEVGVD